LRHSGHTLCTNPNDAAARGDDGFGVVGVDAQPRRRRAEQRAPETTSELA